MNVMPMWICQIPLALNTMTLYWYIKFEKDVTLIVSTNVWLRNIYHVFLVYNPLMFIFVSRGFLRALLRLLDRCLYAIRV